ncbi:MAG: formate/nitrite transporter family protein [Syntrophales bacterium]
MMAALYPIGFILVIFGRSELFTEHTTLAVLPVLDGRASLFSLARLWVIVYFADVLGAAIFSILLVLIGSSLGIIENNAYGEITQGGCQT